MEDNVLALLLKQIDETRAEIARALANGVAEDHAKYRELCGRVWGLSRAMVLIDEMKTRLKMQDD